MAVLITIKTDPKFRPWRAAISTCIQVGIIGIGILANSPAMQWSGFLALVLIAITAAITSDQKNTSLTIEQARARLDAIENLDRIRVVHDYGL